MHEAVDAQIVLFDSRHGSFRFRHALSRDAVLAGLFPAELEVLSRRALDAVETAHPGLEEGWGELAAELAPGAGDRAERGGFFWSALAGRWGEGPLRPLRKPSTAPAACCPAPTQ